VYVRVAGEPNPYCWDVPSYYPGPDKYTIRALPAESIVASLPAPAPPPPSDACVAAKTAVTKETASIVKLKKSITLHSGKTQKRLKAKLKKTRSDLAKSQKLVTKSC
jgi:hypothetical protein